MSPKMLLLRIISLHFVVGFTMSQTLPWIAQNITASYYKGEHTIFKWSYSSDNDFQRIRWYFDDGSLNNLIMAILTGESEPGFKLDNRLSWNSASPAAMTLSELRDSDVNGIYTSEVTLQVVGSLDLGFATLEAYDIKSTDPEVTLNGENVTSLINGTLLESLDNYDITVQLQHTILANISITFEPGDQEETCLKTTVCSRSCLTCGEAKKIIIKLNYETYQTEISFSIPDDTTTQTSPPTTISMDNSVTVSVSQSGTIITNNMDTDTVTDNPSVTSVVYDESTADDETEIGLKQWEIGLIAAGAAILVIAAIIIIIYCVRKNDNKNINKDPDSAPPDNKYGNGRNGDNIGYYKSPHHTHGEQASEEHGNSNTARVQSQPNNVRIPDIKSNDGFVGIASHGYDGQGVLVAEGQRPILSVGATKPVVYDARNPNKSIVQNRAYTNHAYESDYGEPTPDY